MGHRQIVTSEKSDFLHGCLYRTMDRGYGLDDSLVLAVNWEWISSDVGGDL